MKRYPRILACSGAILCAALPGHTAAQMLTIGRAIADMSLPSEAVAIDARYDWQRKPTIVQYAPRGDTLPAWWKGARPEWCHEALTWYTAFEAVGNAARNTRVQVRRLRMYVLSNKSRRWTRTDVVDAPYSDLWKYPFEFAGDFSATGARKEAGGGYAIKPAYPNFHHGYGKPSVIDDPSDVRAVFVAMEFRLVVDKPAGPDDRAIARYVVNAGADYYPGRGRSWGVGYAPGVGSGRYLLATITWRTATLLVPNKNVGASFDELERNPPPLN